MGTHFFVNLSVISKQYDIHIDKIPFEIISVFTNYFTWSISFLHSSDQNLLNIAYVSKSFHISELT